MTPLENRPHTALLVIDVQNGGVEGAHRHEVVVTNVDHLVEKAPGRTVETGAVDFGATP